MMIEIMKPDFSFKDDRGDIKQLVHKGYFQVNVISSFKGAVRGGHFHKKNEEAFYIISGKCTVIVENSDGYKEEYQFKEGDMFKIYPYAKHGFVYLEDTILVSMYSQGIEFENGKMDSYTDFIG